MLSTSAARAAGALAAVLVAATAVRAQAAAAIAGRVPVAVARPLPPLDDAYLRTLAGPVGAPDPPTAAVWLEPPTPAPATTPARAAMAQQGFQFRPGLLAVPVGAAVSFPNRDPAYHSIFSYSDTKRFDLGRYLGDDAPPVVVFDRPGLVRIYCEIHEHMRGTILVVDSPWVTTTDPSGRFRLDGIPPGHYRLRVWVDPRRTLERDVTLSNAQTLEVDLVDDAAAE